MFTNTGYKWNYYPKMHMLWANLLNVKIVWLIGPQRISLSKYWSIHQPVFLAYIGSIHKTAACYRGKYHKHKQINKPYASTNRRCIYVYTTHPCTRKNYWTRLISLSLFLNFYSLCSNLILAGFILIIILIIFITNITSRTVKIE